MAFQAASGAMLMHLNCWPWLSPWATSVYALALTGLCWLPMVYLQFWLRNQARTAASMAALPNRFAARFRHWFLLALPAFLAVQMLYGLMVVKPLPLSYR